MQGRRGNAARFRATGGSSVAPVSDELSWAPRATSAEAPAWHRLEKRLQGRGTVDVNRGTGTRSISPFLGLVLQDFEKPDPAIRPVPKDFGNTGFRHLLSQTACDYQQTPWPRCADPSECLNTFRDVGVGVSVLLFPFHAGEKIAPPYLACWRRQTHSAVPNAI